MSKNKMIMLPREVVEQVLDTLNTTHIEAFMSKRFASIESLRAALEQPDAGIQTTVPGGWKLVPVEPTREMMQAWLTEVTPKNAWAAMLDAAPQPPALDQPQVYQSPYLWFDPDTGETWPHDAINRCCHLPDFLIAPYTKGSKMSLDFSLNAADKCVFSRNITHNLNKMARAAGIYDVLWRPDENGITKASQCIELLSAGLLELVRNRAKYETYNSPNGWGIYEHFVPFVAAVLTACCDYPGAEVSVSR